MSDLKLFRLLKSAVTQLPVSAIALEKSLQDVFEKNLETLLGVRFLASEYLIEGGRLDSLGIDENGSPVIVEYKRSSNENVINQGLFYLDWLMSHRKNFEWLVMERLGMDAVKKIDWSGPRLVCIAGDFTRYDENAVRQMNRNIDLIRYKRYGDDLILLEQLTTTTAASAGPPPSASGGGQWVKGKYKTVSDSLAAAPPELRDLYESLKAYCMAQGDDVAEKITEYYVAFRRMKNFATVELRNQLGKILVYAKVDPKTVIPVQGFTRDVTKIGHFGTGNLEITISSMADLELAKPLIDRAYNEA